MSDELYLVSEYSDYLQHYGKSRLDGAPGVGSGRYPLGSGDDPYQHSYDFLEEYDKVRAKYGKDYNKHKKEIAEELGITKYNPFTKKEEPNTTLLDRRISIANEDRRNAEYIKIKQLSDTGLTPTEIAKQLGKPTSYESSIRNILSRDPSKLGASRSTADFLREQVKEKGIIDVGAGAEQSDKLRVPRTTFENALTILEDDGYKVVPKNMGQMTNFSQKTKLMLLCKEDTDIDNLKDYSNIHTIDEYRSYDNGYSFRKSFEYPSSMDSKRLMVRYKEDGGIDKDGLVEIRRNVKDLSLGNSTYAQVRILVDGTHYIKGMAVYSDDMPPGVDVIFNTNKPKGTPVLGPKDNTVLKPIDTKNPDNPFGSSIKQDSQLYFDDPNGKYIDPLTGKRQSLSLINKRAEEGDWGAWKDSLPSQFLSKQTEKFAERQLDISIKEKKIELDEIKSITNPTIKQEMLKSYADECDKQAVHLNAAGLPRQKYQVIIPLTTIGDNQIYAPNYIQGEQVALIRFPHGGTFEIPVLTVNNQNKEGNSIIDKSSQRLDAVGISKKVADQLSGADFDGDTVMVIPYNEKTRIAHRNYLKDLEGFDPGALYPQTETSVRMKKENVQREMGTISNLITDMTIKGATDEELARAVKHSMVIIDAYKHGYDYKLSEAENRIDNLKMKYQKHKNDEGYGGASTLISKAKSEERVPLRQGSPKIDNEGNVIFKTADDYKRFYYNDKGQLTERQSKITKMANTDDARTLISDYNTKMENIYANYANELKALAKEARLLYLDTPNSEYKPEAYKVYKDVVEDIKKDLYLAESNRQKEKLAQIRAHEEMQKIIFDDPTITQDKKLWKKTKDQLIQKWRLRTGSNRNQIYISDKRWEAIQAGAVHHSVILKLLKYSDQDSLRERATPRMYTTLSTAKVNKMKRMHQTGNFSVTEIANSLGVSPSTVKKYLNLMENYTDDEDFDNDN